MVAPLPTNKPSKSAQQAILSILCKEEVIGFIIV